MEKGDFTKGGQAGKVFSDAQKFRPGIIEKAGRNMFLLFGFLFDKRFDYFNTFGVRHVQLSNWLTGSGMVSRR
ncbi:hypothetical protein D9M68_607800 [compost metagenome]